MLDIYLARGHVSELLFTLTSMFDTVMFLERRKCRNGRSSE